MVVVSDGVNRGKELRHTPVFAPYVQSIIRNSFAVVITEDCLAKSGQAHLRGDWRDRLNADLPRA